MPTEPTTDELLRMTLGDAQTAEGHRRDIDSAFRAAKRSFLLLLSITRSTLGSHIKAAAHQHDAETKDQLLKLAAAGAVLGVSRQFIRDHESDLPFTVRLPNGTLRVSERRMREWIDGQLEVPCTETGRSIGERTLGFGGYDIGSRESRSPKARRRRRSPKRGDA